ncbi:hypothetical protein HK105_208174 [Polyrhizophydium stewartii]|uniref:Protein kinase domain-containing protein n=1 Tax=Polyrhizophydium stewartii TaxID=2732419 RepID=A0ABR4MYF1_9FUNG
MLGSEAADDSLASINQAEQGVLANPSAAAALAAHARAAAEAARTVGAGPAAALAPVLAAAERLLSSTAARSPVHQALCAAATADRIRSLDARLAQLQPAPQDEIAAAIADDSAQLPELVRRLAEAGDAALAGGSGIETLAAIDRHGQALLSGVPEGLRPQAAALLDAARAAAAASSGRSLRPHHSWDVDADDVDIDRSAVLGRGRSGSVARGWWRGNDVAVKLMDAATSEIAVTELERRLDIWAALDHPNVLKLHGACLNASVLFVVLPRMHSSVAEFLRRNPDTSIEVRSGFLAAAANGMQHLHAQPQPIVHGGISASNILIDHGGEVRLSDIGIGCIDPAVLEPASANAVRWAAPELAGAASGHSPESDVFAFGLTALEILAGGSVAAAASAAVVEGRPLERPEDIPDAAWDVIHSCLDTDPTKRPPASEIANRLDALPTVSGSFWLLAPSAPDGDEAHGQAEDPPSPSRSSALGSLAGHDIEHLLAAFPAWCKAKGITRRTFRNFREMVKMAVSSYPVLEWAADGRLVALRLKNQRLRGAIPEQVCQLVSLRQLHLANNSFTHIPDGINALANLTRLDLSSNQISHVPDSLCLLSKLSVLHLNFNNIAHLPDRIGSLALLTELWLSNNQLKQLPPSVGELMRLRWLVVTNNQLTELPDTMVGMVSLTNLHAENNKLTQLPPGMAQLAHLTDLRLNGNPVPAKKLAAINSKKCLVS